MKWKVKSISHVRLFLTHELLLARLLLLWDFPGKNTGLCCHFLLEVIFPKTLGESNSRRLKKHKSYNGNQIFSTEFSSVAQSCPTLCDPMNHSTPGLPVHHHLPEFTQTDVHQVGDAIQPSHPLSFPFPPAPNPWQHQSLFQ